MDERLRFVAKLLDGESMTDACHEFGISRKTATRYSIATRESGFESSDNPFGARLSPMS